MISSMTTTRLNHTGSFALRRMASPISTDVDALPKPGTQFFLPSLLAHVRAALPGLPLEPVIIQVLLLCITSGDRNLILRAHDDDIDLVAKLTTIALGSVFGYNVHKVKYRTDACARAPSQILQSLFLPAAVTAGTDSSRKNREKHRRMSSSRNSSGKQPTMMQATTSNVAHSGSNSFSRSVSYPGNSWPSTSAPRQRNLDSEPHNVPTIPMANLKRPTLRSFSVHETEPSIPTIAFHGRPHPEQSLHASMDNFRVPAAIVVSGLEHASLQSQKAILRALAARKLVFSSDRTSESGQMFDFPENFILVYICRLDARERPPIYKSLLDRFAMSSPVSISQQTRLAMRQFRLPSTQSSALPSSSSTSGASAALLISPSGPSVPAIALPGPPISSPILRRLRDHCAHHTYVGAPLDTYLADLFTATRHFSSLDGTFLTVRARQDAEALIRASRVLGIDPTGAEFIKEAAHGAPPASDGCSSQRSYSASHSSASLSSDALLDSADFPQLREPSLAPGIECNPASICIQKDASELDVSEADIARMFPRVVSHRVRVRDSPFDEVLSSAVCGDMFQPAGAKDGDPVWERDTVKDILVRILSEV
ncbi:hypothetical protein EDC04DRAFT_2677952 [Pisolithus marmoratus]|nr:hypothetical protein EDC04DRAFT_2677952 [Pisolithus marmoratus]